MQVGSLGVARMLRLFLYMVQFCQAMQISFDSFIKNNDAKPLDFDGAFQTQCMDLAQFYNRDVIAAPRLYGNAINQWNSYPREAYTRTAYKPGLAPIKGDIMIWGSGVGQFGHIAVFISIAGAGFMSLDQNWPLGSRCHKQQHNWNGVLGWLRAIALPMPMPVISPDDIKDYFRKIWGKEPAYGDWRYFDYRLHTAKNIIGEADMLVKMDFWFGRVYDRITGKLNPDGDKIWQREKAKYPL